jgi:HK97 family phage major capsid protein
MKKVKEKQENRFKIVGIIAAVIVMFAISAIPELIPQSGALAGLLHIPAGVTVCYGAILAGINFSEKTLLELQQIRGEKFNELEGILNKCTEEKRDLNADEITKRDSYMKALKKLDDEIRFKQEIEEKRKLYAGNQFKKDGEERAKKEVAAYSVIKAMRESVQAMTSGGKGLTGVELEMHQEAEREAKNSGIEISGLGIPQVILKRDMSATGQTAIPGDQGGLTIQTQKLGLIDSLRAKMVLSAMGVQYLTGLTGNISIPKKTSAISAAWDATENSDTAESQNVFGAVAMSPKRLSSFAEISKQLLIQSSLDVEKMVIGDIELAIRLALETAAINGTGANGQPYGILNTVGIGAVAGGANGLAPAWSHIVDLESLVAIANADLGNLGYLSNPSVRGKLKQTSKVANQNGFIWDAGENPLNGYKAGVTSLVPNTLVKGASGAVCSAIIFGNFNDMIIGQWAGLDLVIDPYTKAKSNQLVITVNSFWDIAIRNPESFAAMVDALTA